MAGRTRWALILVSAITTVTAAAWLFRAPARGDAAVTDEYARWVKKYGLTDEMSMGRAQGAGPPRLIVAMVDHEPQPGQKTFDDRGVISGTELSIDGFRHGFSISSMGAKGSSGGEALPADQLKRLDELFIALPDDEGKLPPPERRVLIQSLIGRKRHVFDECGRVERGQFAALVRVPQDKRAFGSLNDGWQLRPRRR
jgi:hypothetical protein